MKFSDLLTSLKFHPENFIIPLLFIAVVPAYTQQDSFPCLCSNSELKNLFKGETLNSLFVLNCYGPGLGSMSSSFLLPGGSSPKVIPNEDGTPPDDSAYVEWTCRYSPGNIADYNPATAWVEGADGQGIGEVVIVPCLELEKPVKIWAGYGKSSTVFYANSRPKKIKVVVIRSEPVGASQYGTNYANLKVIASKEISLQDENAYQNLMIPDFKKDFFNSSIYGDITEYRYFLGIEILAVYPGKKYKDTCISEVIN